MESRSDAPAKRNPIPMIIAIIVAAILSLCCCGSGLPVFLGLGKYNLDVFGAQANGVLPTTYGWICVGAGIIPWVIPLIVAIAKRVKK